jgi:hypothetical protein
LPGEFQFLAGSNADSSAVFGRRDALQHGQVVAPGKRLLNASIAFVVITDLAED